MSKVYFFMNTDIKPLDQKKILPDVYCPVGGYFDKSMNKYYGSKGEKDRDLKSHKMREAELVNPNKSIGGTEGCSLKQRGNRGNFKARPMPSWMTQELSKQL